MIIQLLYNKLTRLNLQMDSKTMDFKTMDSKTIDFKTTFSKCINGVIPRFKETAQVMISNGSKFSCQCLDISTVSDESTTYPDASDLSTWIKHFMTSELKSKPLNPKALEEMAKKGIQPKKQPNEIILVAIVPSVTHIHIGVSIPESMDSELNVESFISNTLSSYSYEIDIDKNFGFANIEHPESLKERDNVLRCFFTELKNRKIYIEDAEDDEVITYVDVDE
jgi:hypothetical protein